MRYMGNFFLLTFSPVRGSINVLGDRTSVRNTFLENVNILLDKCFTWSYY